MASVRFSPRPWDLSFGPEEKTDDSFRISLAGAQEKTALLWHEGAWHKPTGATPTTHIFKLPMGVSPHGIDLSTSVENEWLCAQIVGGFSIPVAPCQMATFGDYKTLIVERFDRKLAPDDAWWLRLPQEDFCQATGTPPAYASTRNEGSPGIRKIMELLLGSQRAEEDRRDFMRTQLLCSRWLLAAIDGHAKNFSTTSTVRWRLPAHSAMAISYPPIPCSDTATGSSHHKKSPWLWRWREKIATTTGNVSRRDIGSKQLNGAALTT